MEKQLTTKQTAIIMFVLMVASKLIMLPSIISFVSANDTWLVFLLAFCVDFLIGCLIVATICKTDKTFFQILRQKLGGVVAVAIFALLGVFFVLKTTNLMFETYIMFNEKIYIDLSPVLFLAVMLAVVVYFGTRQLRSLGRTLEIVFFLLCMAIALGYFISFSGADFSNILPVGESGFGQLSQNMFRHLFWFGDSFVMLLFVGNVKTDKKTSKIILIYYFVAMLVVLAFVILFVAIFANTAPMHRNCILDVGEDLPRLLTEGRFNWIVDFVYPIAPIFAVGLYGFFAIKCFGGCAKQNNAHTTSASCAICVLGIVLTILSTGFVWGNLYGFVVNYLPYVCILLQYILPVAVFLMVFLSKSGRGKKA